MAATLALPKHLKIVGWFFIFVGFLALIHTLYLYFNTPTPYPNFLLVFIFVGFGLLKCKPMWRSFALACSGVMLVFTLGNIFIVLSGHKSLQGVPDTVLIMFWVQALLGVAVSAYALWALQTKEVKRAFNL